MAFTPTEIKDTVKFCGYSFDDYGLSQVALLLGAVTTRGSIYEQEIRNILTDINTMAGNARSTKTSGDFALAKGFQQEAEYLVQQLASLARLTVQSNYFSTSQGRINRA
jgi:hypothetical protein